jgi:hypothetical protein
MRAQCGGDSKQGDYHETGNEQPLHRNLRLARNAEWFAPPDYSQRLQADVICLTYHGLVCSDVRRFYRVSGPAMYRRSSTIANLVGTLERSSPERSKSHVHPDRQSCSSSGGSPCLSAISWQTLTISVRISNTTRSMFYAEPG